MDHERVARGKLAPAAGTSRRRVAVLMGGLVIAAPLAALGPAGTEAGRRKKKRWTPQTTFGGQGSGPDQFSRPRGLAVAADGLLVYVADGNNDRVSIWRRPGTGGTAWVPHATFGRQGGGVDQLNAPEGVFVSASGLDAWVADDFNNRVAAWSPTDDGRTAWAGQAPFGAAGSGAGQFSGPMDIAVAADGLTAWVVDFGNHRVAVWRRADPGSAWGAWTAFGSEGNGALQLQWPVGIRVADDGLTAYVADSGNHRVAVWRRSTTAGTDWLPWTTFGGQGSGPGQLDSPYGIAVSRDGLTAWVSDSGNDRVSIWKRPSRGSARWTNTATFGARGTQPGQFKQPWGIAASRDGATVYVSDFDNHRVAVWVYR